MKIKSRHKLIPAIAMVLVSAVVLSSASYAWFTMSRTVTATGISLTAVAPTNLLINNKDEENTYGESTLIADAQKYIGKLIPASSTIGSTMYAPENSVLFANKGAPDATTKFVVTTKALTNTDSAKEDETGFYVDYTLFLKTTGGKDVKVTVDELTTEIKNTATTADDKSIINAVRFAILDDQKAVFTKTAGNVAGRDAENNTYAFSGATSTPEVVSGKVTGTQPLFGDPVVGPINGVSTQNGSEWKGEALTTNNDTTNAQFIVKADGTPTQITVRVWIEGQAAACVDKAALSQFDIVLGFKAIDNTTVTP